MWIITSFTTGQDPIQFPITSFEILRPTSQAASKLFRPTTRRGAIEEAAPQIAQGQLGNGRPQPTRPGGHLGQTEEDRRCHTRLSRFSMFKLTVQSLRTMEAVEVKGICCSVLPCLRPNKVSFLFPLLWHRLSQALGRTFRRLDVLVAASGDDTARAPEPGEPQVNPMCGRFW